MSTHAQQSDSPNRGIERRKHERTSFVTDVTVTEFDEQYRPSGTWACTAQDLSRGGIGLLSRRMVHVGRELALRLTAPDGRIKLLFGVVRVSRYDSGRGYLVGVQFKALPEAPGFLRWKAAEVPDIVAA